MTAGTWEAVEGGPVAADNHVGREQLERWLLPASPFLTSERGRRRRFVFAALRDVFATDREVERWLSSPCADLDGAVPADLLGTARASEVELEVVRVWNGK
jgi:uncharacterized protein (DUF2384 family)